MKKFLLIITMFILISLSVFAGNEVSIFKSQVGIVNKIDYVDSFEKDFEQTKQLVEVKILNGNLKNETVVLENVLTGNPYYDINLKKGTKVLLHTEQEDGVLNISIENVYRANYLLYLGLIFAGLLIYVGKKKGVNSLISIAITCVLITHFLTPLILFGINPVLATILICILSTTATMYLVGGFNRKSTSATIGCTLSLIIAGMLSFITIKIASINGFIDEQTMFLYSARPELNFVAITISAMILATLGAVMDVAMSIASTINEIYLVDNSKTVKDLFICGMNVGRDIIGTMANTLILVYLGTSLPLLLLASNIDFSKFMSLSQVFTEISSALIGSSAIVICVPITAFITSELLKNIPTRTDFSDLEN